MIDRDELRRLCAQTPSLSLKEIGQYFSVSKQRIHQVIQEMSINKPRPPHRPRPKHKCPDCGGQKSDKARRCKRCNGLRKRKGKDVISLDGYAVLPRYLQEQYGVLFRHQVVAMQKIGRRFHDGEEVHHIDGNKLNNHPDNLMIVTRSEHKRLHSKGRRCREQKLRLNSQGYRGVCIDKSGHHRWYARIGYNGRRHYLGRFDSPEDAARAYNDAAQKYYDERAVLNKIPYKD